MRFQTRLAFRVSQIKNGTPFPSQFQASRLFCHHHHSEQHQKWSSSFGIAFDIDGVILRGRVPVGGSPQALKRLYGENGGGIPESQRALELTDLLGVKILPSQVLQGHSPFKNLLKRYENQLIVATGKGEPAYVMSEYGFKKVLSVDEYASLFENIDPVAQYKKWTTKQVSNRTNRTLTENMKPRYNVASEAVKAVFVVSDPVDWGRDIQVLCDILRSGGLPGQENGHQPPLYFAADDLEYQAAFPSKRLGMGAFRMALESIFNRIHHDALKYTTFGKPNPPVFQNAEAVLNQLQLFCQTEANLKECGNPGSFPLNTLYMIGDNPSVDVKGAQQAGNSWFSILTRTGVFRGEHNDAEFPADMVVNTVEEAVEYILQRERDRECISRGNFES
ncbi:mitochondrial hydrolase YKR070W-like isoform X2 [Euphorbia lathyris]|uniref:mitochondrial hydrolase YKR070W-like isoform X2 n=1 Tax=Euphorbia lathyris TaxID=212925 RepID=UPI003313CD1B